MAILLRDETQRKLEPIFGSVTFYGHTQLFLDRDLKIAICGHPAEVAAWLREMADKVEPKTVAQVMPQ